ncbi:MAG: signal peptide peptidase SppA [Eggerthellaceae bacterium]|nr:signal peptide peptidase SppA [Eggerthellaceae bacterium]
MAFGIKSCNDSMASFSDLSTTGDYGLSALEKDAIAVLVLDGTIQYDGTACSPEGFKELLDKADENDHVKALVLRVNSGGGTATAGEEMAEYLRQFTKPVVVSSASINASAAYEISSQADYIYVAKSTEIGSIGTAMELTDLSGLLDKLGIKMETITSADSKDSSYGYRGLSDDEREYYQNMINQINEMFIENVAEGRHMDIEDVRKLATGLVFTGVDATKNGLADAIGTREDAVKKAAELAGITDYTTTDLKFSSYDFSELAYLFGEDRSLNQYLLKLKDLLENAEQAGLL